MRGLPGDTLTVGETAMPPDWRLGRLRNAVPTVIDTEHKTVHFVEDRAIR